MIRMSAQLAWRQSAHDRGNFYVLSCLTFSSNISISQYFGLNFALSVEWVIAPRESTVRSQYSHGELCGFPASEAKHDQFRAVSIPILLKGSNSASTDFMTIVSNRNRSLQPLAMTHQTRITVSTYDPATDARVRPVLDSIEFTQLSWILNPLLLPFSFALAPYTA